MIWKMSLNSSHISLQTHIREDNEVETRKKLKTPSMLGFGVCLIGENYTSVEFQPNQTIKIIINAT